MHIISSVVYNSKLIMHQDFSFGVSEINKRYFKTAGDYKPI